MKFTVASAILGAAMLAQQSIAHPGQSKAELQKEIQERAEYLATHKRSLTHCSEKLKARGNDALMQARRSAKLDSLRKKRSISQDKPLVRARSLEGVLNTDHHSNLTVTPDTDPDIIFAGNNSCILSPETTEGPYWVAGELVRENLVEEQAGIPLILDLQVIDVDTCEPVPRVFTEIWSCNSTGVYGGVIADGNGNLNDTANLDKSFLRGIQPTDDDGVVAFETIFPGHYIGRTTHIHVLTHLGATENANKTISGGAITHVGQIYFDQDLITLAEKQEPYTTNLQPLTTNEEDFILRQQAVDEDPMVEYVFLGDDISEGLFGWLAFGMDTTAVRNVTPAVYWTEEGGVKNPNAPAGPPFGPPPSGLPPSGPRPTNVA